LPARASGRLPRARAGAVAVVAGCALAVGCGGDRRAAPRQDASPAIEPASATTTTIAVVLATTGDVRIQRDGVGAWTAVGPGTEIRKDDTVQAMADGHATLRLATTGAELAIEPGTTLRVAGPSAPVQASGGRMIAQLADDRAPRRLELALPPGLLVLTTDPVHQPRAEAIIEVAADTSSIEMRVGAGEVIRTTGPTIAIAARRWVRFDRDGEVADRGELGPSPTLLSPADGASLRVRREVELRWEPVAQADRYRVLIDSGEVQRRLDASEPTLRVAMASGRYRWTVQALAGDLAWPAAPARALIVEVDDRPPPLTLSAPAAGATVVGPHLRLVGDSEAGAVIEAAGRRVTADAHGRFTLDIAIARGLTNLVVSARDELGNQRRVTRSVLWE
jgi:hypothetical protein